MLLNLNALKNVSPVVPALDIENTAVSSPTQTSETVASEDKQEVKITTAGPKISLMKLKKASWAESSSATVTETIQTELSVQDIEKQTEKDIITRDISTESIEISEERATTHIDPEETVVSILVPTEETVSDSKESMSIFSNSESSISDTLVEEVSKTEEIKELFPNFQLSHKMDFEDDGLGLQDLITVKEKDEAIAVPEETTPIINQEETIAPELHEETLVTVEPTVTSIEISTETPSDILSQESNIIPEMTDTSISEPVLETIMETAPSVESSNDTPITVSPEYVAEVKTELSEGRRAGFRFFTQKKTKIMAGVSFLVISTVTLTLFSNSFFSPSIKTNVQENVKNTDSETTTVPSVWSNPEPEVTTADTGTVIPSTTSPTNTTGYELGRDYSVTKNTKKNVHSKTSPTELPDTEIPTP